VYLEVDANKTCYVVLPNGSVLTSTAGVINDFWGGIAGRVKLIVPKNTTTTKLDNGVVFADYLGNYECNNSGDFSAALSDLTSIKVNNKSSISVGGSLNLVSLECNNATAVYASNCALTAKSIGDFLIAASTNNPTAIGTANFSAGTNAIYGDVASYLTGIGVSLPGGSLTGWITQNLPNWTITLN